MHFLAPDGAWVMLGDTNRGRPDQLDVLTRRGVVDGPAPDGTVVFEQAGHLFVRDGGGRPDGGDLWAFRFGPPMDQQAHAHEDLGNVLLYAGGDRLVEGTGLYAYRGGEGRRTVLANASHNVVVIDDADYDRSASGELTAHGDDAGVTWARMRTTALAGAEWTRTVLVDPDRRLMVVDDRIAQPLERTVRQRWHFAEDAMVDVAGDTATVGGDGATLHILVLGAAHDGLEVGRGSRSIGPGVLVDVPRLDVVSVGSTHVTTVLSLGRRPSTVLGFERGTAGFALDVEAGGVVTSYRLDGGGLAVDRPG